MRPLRAGRGAFLDLALSCCRWRPRILAVRARAMPATTSPRRSSRRCRAARRVQLDARDIADQHGRAAARLDNQPLDVALAPQIPLPRTMYSVSAISITRPPTSRLLARITANLAQRNAVGPQPDGSTVTWYLWTKPPTLATSDTPLAWSTDNARTSPGWCAVRPARAGLRARDIDKPIPRRLHPGRGRRPPLGKRPAAKLRYSSTRERAQ